MLVQSSRIYPLQVNGDKFDCFVIIEIILKESDIDD